MKIFTNDILEEIEKQYVSEKQTAMNLLTRFCSDNPELSERVVRCILFLSGSSIENLKENIKMAQIDWRDIISDAEYETSATGETKKIRDFNNPFGTL